MSQPIVVVTRRVFPEVLERLAEFEVIDNQEDIQLDAEGIARRSMEADFILSTVTDRIDASVLAHAAQLKAVCNIGVGYNNIDVSACCKRGVMVTNTPDVLNETTADMAFALLLATARRVTEAEAYLRNGEWKRWEIEQLLGVDVYGSTLGILGMGRIGSAIARRARGFGMNVIYQNRSRAQDEQGAQWVDKETLLRTADHVVLVLPYSAATHHTIAEAELALMKPTAILINIARGGIVDDAALARALKSGRIGGAGLDVYEHEPALHPALLECRNVVLTPHIGSATRSTRLAMCNLAVDNLLAIGAGQTPLNAVS
jgi:lactate dehydrogenase-like 2-hydroxyacid dehydrogenase